MKSRNIFINLPHKQYAEAKHLLRLSHYISPLFRRQYILDTCEPSLEIRFDILAVGIAIKAQEGIAKLRVMQIRLLSAIRHSLVFDAQQSVAGLGDPLFPESIAGAAEFIAYMPAPGKDCLS